MKGYTQKDKLLRISTFLDREEAKYAGDPLLLVKLDGTEGISRPFSYDIVLLRDADPNERPELDLRRLINAEAYLGARSGTGEQFLYRVGIIESVQEVIDVDTVKIWPFTVRKFYIYRGRVVPAVKLLSRDVCFRVFEGKTVYEIIEDAKADIAKAFPQLAIDTSAVADIKFPKMEYCVQYGESTLDFLSRLMARFGIGYYFGHKTGDPNLLNETMVLQSYSSFSFPECRHKTVTIADDPSATTISTVTRYFQPAQSKFCVGSFNPLDPAKPFIKQAAVTPSRDFLQPTKSPWFATASFGEPVASANETEALAEARRLDAQSNVVTISAKSRNPSFLSGHSFAIAPIDGGDLKGLAEHAFVIDGFTLSAHDYNYENLFGWQVLDAFFNTFSTVDSDLGSLSDAALAKVSTWVSNCAQNWSPAIYPNINYFGSPTAPGVLNLPIGKTSDWPALTFLQPLWAFMWLCIQSIDLKKLVQDQKNEASYANSLFAIPVYTKDYSVMRSFPLPLAPHPVARGPESAVVVGPEGSSSANGDFYADTLGRVRVRFPWDPGPPSGGERLPPHLPLPDPNVPYRTGGNTCWVRVVEGWAGRSFGTQFLPRIGQEVLVDFVDGDPERPIITGRLYNADQARSNLPLPGFDPTDAQNQIIMDEKQNSLLDPTIALPYTRSGIKTRLTPGGSGFHLLRFDDNAEAPQFLLRSQGRFDVTAYCSRYETTHGNRYVKIVPAKDKNGKPLGGNSLTTVGSECDVHVGGARYEQVEKNYELTVKADTLLDLEGKLTAVIGGKASIAADDIVLQATTKITLKVGSSTIVVTPAAIFLNGPVLHHNAGDGGAESADSVTLQNVGDAKDADDGTKYTATPTECGRQADGRGGGARGTHTAAPVPALPVSSDPLDSTNIELITEGNWPSR